MVFSWRKQVWELLPCRGYVASHRSEENHLGREQRRGKGKGIQMFETSGDKHKSAEEAARQTENCQKKGLKAGACSITEDKGLSPGEGADS